MSPIRPENRHRYPADWKEIRKRILYRAEMRCEMYDEAGRCSAEHGKVHPLTGSIVVLTVMHLDHIPENCSEENLRAACQKCHNTYDMPTRVANRRKRLAREAGQEELPL